MIITIEGDAAEVTLFVQELMRGPAVVLKPGAELPGPIILKSIPKEPQVAPEQPKKERPVKKEWSEEQKKDIQRIKDAHKAKREEVKFETVGKRTDIDDTLIVYMRDEQGKTLKEIAKQIGCSQQTVLNRYNRAKRDTEKGDKK